MAGIEFSVSAAGRMIHGEEKVHWDCLFAGSYCVGFLAMNGMGRSERME